MNSSASGRENYHRDHDRDRDGGDCRWPDRDYDDELEKKSKHVILIYLTKYKIV